MEKEHHEVTEVKEIFEGTELAKGKTYNLKDLTGSYLIKAINENNYSPEMVAAIAELYESIFRF